MSQLIEKFRKAIQASERPMGFLSSRLNQPAPKLILIAGIDAGKPCDGSALGHADAVFLRADQAENPAEAIRKMASSLGNLPWGTRLEEAISHARTGKAKAGAEPDFVVFSATSEVRSLPQDENTGKILQIEDSMDDGLIRAVNSLPVDAVLVASMSDSAALVWHCLLYTS
ncbi:MAG: hypothetical protein N2506_06880, partial [Dehalococcoidales bacterium]|nr:hypothetical protein [Dehalococcoidales bacterium]